MHVNSPICVGDVVYFVHINNMIGRVRAEIMPPAPVIAVGRDFIVVHAERDMTSSFSNDRDFLIPREMCSHSRDDLEDRFPSLLVYTIKKGDAVGYMVDGDPRHGIVVDRGGDGGYHYQNAWVDILNEDRRVTRVPRNCVWLIQEASYKGSRRPSVVSR